MKLIFVLLILTISVTCTLESKQCGENELYFDSDGCESGSRDSCYCSQFTTDDCRWGCMCKNGYCRKNGYNSPCEKRDCVHPVYN
ncbi:hypothetical protein PVAND_017173 [Polypedilum vanderplanki]|uniref:Uncharacterized protein n=1 Tax=Polypedilum vanderplanki TaxID=319348 RepID=A0A9J6BIB7_POLVA|nr:hypothetical protein PVAND_017173 [Polypedilum vanderplanki]